MKNELNFVSWLNIALMIVSVVVAYFIPFELLLFSYAILGPAHYLTEISWLHDRKYFTTGDKDYLFLVLLGVLILVVRDPALNYSLMIIAFVSAIFMVAFRDLPKKALGILAVVVLVVFLRNALSFGHEFSIMLATILHVYFFTGAFILYGALKRKSLLDIGSLAVYLGCAIVFFIFPPNAESYVVGKDIGANIVYFENVNQVVLSILSLENNWSNFVAVMGFFAFAYTYHYLNWFSKTKIIRWHEISKDRLFTIILAYALSLILYAYDFTLGFFVLLFLSLLHVLLEFPLNHRSFHGIATELKVLFRRA